jgi:protein gp37
MENTKIEWTGTFDANGVLQAGYTFNPWIGCTKVSPACAHCYAEMLMDTRYGRVEWGKGKSRSRTSVANWKLPFKWNKKTKESGTRAKVFCASLADIFDAEVDPAWRHDFWALIRATPDLDWLSLTKRPENMPTMVPEDWGQGYPNVWLGTSVEDQYYADLRIPWLTAVPAVVHFLSVEPMLGPIEFKNLHGIEWVIVGGESGPGSRPMKKAWVLEIHDQVVAAGVALFFKQWGNFNEAGENVGKMNAGHLLDGEVYHEFPVAEVNDSLGSEEQEVA